MLNINIEAEWIISDYIIFWTMVKLNYMRWRRYMMKEHYHYTQEQIIVKDIDLQHNLTGRSRKTWAIFNGTSSTIF
mgnify:CR=1 FL=1